MNDNFLTLEEINNTCSNVETYFSNDNRLFDVCRFYTSDMFPDYSSCATDNVNQCISDFENYRISHQGIPGSERSVFDNDFQFELVDYIYSNYDYLQTSNNFDYPITEVLYNSTIDKYTSKKNENKISVDVSHYYKDIFPNVDIVSNTFISSVTFVIGFVILILVIKKGIKYFVNIIKYKGFGSGLAKQDYDMYLNDKVNEDHENNFDL